MFLQIDFGYIEINYAIYNGSFSEIALCFPIRYVFFRMGCIG